MKKGDTACMNCGFSSSSHAYRSLSDTTKLCPVFQDGLRIDWSNTKFYTPGYIIDDTYDSIFDELDKIRFHLIRKQERTPYEKASS